MSGTKRKTIIIVDDSPANLQIIISSLKAEYNVIPFTSGLEAIEFFRKGQICNLILMDIEMPDINGFDTLKIIKQMPKIRNIPVIFLTGKSEMQSELEGLSLGAVDYIYKPFNPLLVKKRINIHIELEEYNINLEKLVERKTRTIEKLSDVTISTIISLIGTRDQESGGHINRTSEYVVALANELLREGLYKKQLTKENIYLLRKSAPLHDVGKIGISDTILKKPGRLTPEEFNEMKKHTVIGGDAFDTAAKVMNEPSFLDVAKVLALYHHEKWNGTGYPYGLKETMIPLFARIMAIADVYDALISVRPYKTAMTHKEAVEIISNGIGTHFDPDIGNAFLSINTVFDNIAKKFEDNKLLE